MYEVGAFLRSNGFNAVRLPLAADGVAVNKCGRVAPPRPPSDFDDDEDVERHTLVFGVGEPVSGNPPPPPDDQAEESLSMPPHSAAVLAKNPAMAELRRYEEVVEHVVKELGKHGILVLLELRSAEAGGWPKETVLADDKAPSWSAEGRRAKLLRDGWRKLAALVCDATLFWNVLGADLKYEPRGMYWGPPASDTAEGTPYDASHRWDTLATELGNLGMCTHDTTLDLILTLTPTLPLLLPLLLPLTLPLTLAPTLILTLILTNLNSNPNNCNQCMACAPAGWFW